MAKNEHEEKYDHSGHPLDRPEPTDLKGPHVDPDRPARRKDPPAGVDQSPAVTPPDPRR